MVFPNDKLVFLQILANLIKVSDFYCSYLYWFCKFSRWFLGPLYFSQLSLTTVLTWYYFFRIKWNIYYEALFIQMTLILDYLIS